MNGYLERVYYVIDSFMSWIHEAFSFVSSGIGTVKESFGFMIDAAGLLPSFAIGAAVACIAIAFIYLILGR